MFIETEWNNSKLCINIGKIQMVRDYEGVAEVYFTDDISYILDERYTDFVKRLSVMYSQKEESESKIYRNMSDKEFEKWLREHGICNPNIHEPIQCNVIPSLIDNAINDLIFARQTGLSVPIDVIIENLKDFPSARVTRKWIPDSENRVRCSNCKKTYDWDSEAQYYDFCPVCGADMRGDRHE